PPAELADPDLPRPGQFAIHARAVLLAEGAVPLAYRAVLLRLAVGRRGARAVCVRSRVGAVPLGQGRGWPGEGAACPGREHLALGEPMGIRASPDHDRGVQANLDSRIDSGESHRISERKPGVRTVAAGVEYDDILCASLQRLDQAKVVIASTVGHVDPRPAIAGLPDRLCP